MEPLLHAEAVRAWWRSHGPAVLVEVTATRGSVPREQGTRMLVAADGFALGTIGGGHLEWQAMAQAREMLSEGGDAAPHTRRVALGPSLGQCCGGEVSLHFEVLGERLLATWPGPQPLFHLVLFGAGHVGRAIARLLAGLDVSVAWVDEREQAFPDTLQPGVGWPAHIARVSCDAVVGEVGTAPPGAFYLVLTHQHDLDLTLAEAILRRADAGFFGLIGSATKRARFEHRLLARGVPAGALARMACPIGLPGIAGKSPEVIAISAVAQLLQAAGGGHAATSAASP
jgi:xanthine dehydrogenase accessory factor